MWSGDKKWKRGKCDRETETRVGWVKGFVCLHPAPVCLHPHRSLGNWALLPSATSTSVKTLKTFQNLISLPQLLYKPMRAKIQWRHLDWKKGNGVGSTPPRKWCCHLWKYVKILFAIFAELPNGAAPIPRCLYVNKIYWTSCQKLPSTRKSYGRVSQNWSCEPKNITRNVNAHWLQL